MHHKIISTLKIAAIAILLLNSSCVDPYLERFTGTETIFIVDGRLSDDTRGNFIKLTQSVPQGETSTSYLPVENAEVKVMINDNDFVSLTETKLGYYSFPDGFSGEVGNTYQLQFNTPDGKYFESRAETMASSPEINKVYHNFDAEAVETTEDTFAGHQIYIDTKDPVETKDFYMWDWVLYEQQFWCKTCESAYYYNDATTGPLGVCRAVRWPRGKIDYKCDGRCWDIILSSKANVMNDDFSNGQEIKARLVAEIPIYQKIGSLFEVRQYGISEEVYNYLRLVVSQGQETGGLADTPPATLSGNIASPSNSEQPVAGYFIVASVSKALHWLDKSDVPMNTKARGLFDGRTVRPEPASNDLTRPPIAPCVESDVRTAIEPFGWIEGTDEINS